MKIKKYIALGLLSGVLFSTVTPTALAAESVAKNESERMLRAWPGRPGGNGDGSEEWLQGSYGQTNGPYKWIGSSQGLTEDLNNRDRRLIEITTEISLYFITKTPSTSKNLKRILKIFGVKTLLKNIWKNRYEGAYYNSNTYVSGRCMKTVITTYKNSDYTGYVKTYTSYYKW
ncbi:hypothetical protein SAMN05421767_1702 [Granulicatella balaenopterae]|uniref:Uncharacterized protein n=1 Tax=Granulicatella balaenopterae TaxID=137733 RepID=A0A1H9PSM6_9LACT|nr:hypothetical protein [Granulicatella balaenopterae]SER51316.1 hypothetical protein SAMN05421767_1702 [Granulicatella balaenopterae]